jgi:hypothetical protein
MKRKRHIAALSLIVLACVGLGGVELSLRYIKYAQPPHNLLPDGTPTHGHPYEDRNRYVDATFSDDTFNIVVFGGAWTFALGCTNEESYAGLLERELRQNRKLAVRVVNMGQPDFSSQDIVNIFERSTKRYKADLAVIMTGLRDCIPDYLQDNFSARKPFSIGSDTSLASLRIQRLWDNRRFATFLNRRDIDREDRKDYVVRHLTLAESQMALLEIGLAAHEAGIKTLFITYPKLGKSEMMRPHYPLYSRRNFLIRTAASNLDQMLVDLEEKILPEQTPNYMHDWMRWPHPNPYGHQYIADEILMAIAPLIVNIPRT